FYHKLHCLQSLQGVAEMSADFSCGAPELVARIVAAATKIREHADMLLKSASVRDPQCISDLRLTVLKYLYGSSLPLHEKSAHISETS
ncbi:hypothetical protein L9F63_024611, partial [Diploptera punctata]